MIETFEPVDAYDRRLAAGLGGELGALNRAGVLEASDVLVAQRLGRIGEEDRCEVLVALALVVKAARQGSVCVDLTQVPALPQESGLAWPDHSTWLQQVGTSPLVAQGVLRIDSGLLYLDRYWTEEGAVVDDLRSRLAVNAPPVDRPRLSAALSELFAGPTYSEQRLAAEESACRWTSVITGGPGTGKTTTLARLLAALVAASDEPPRIALAAPTGKAAARMTQAIADAAAAPDFPAPHRPALEGLAASTLHRLLGTIPRQATRYRHDRHNRLPHDIVVVDETSMVSITLMARLIEAVRPDARLVLVGDPDQLTSVEAGAVLQDLVAGLADGADSPVSGLTRTFRFGDAIGALAQAIRAGDQDHAWDLLTSGDDAVVLIDPGDLRSVRAAVEPTALALLHAAERGEQASALAHLEAHRLLCAHREGPHGVGHWNRQIERWLLDRLGRDWFPSWYAGQPLIVNSNDYGLRLWNGDTGVVLAGGPASSGLQAVFADGTTGRPVNLTRLSDVTTAHAMTVHRSQGSQFREVSVLLPPPESPTLTRELLYTAITRAQDRVRVIATEESVRAAITRPAQRATGLAARLRP